MTYSFLPNIPTDTLVREENSDRQANKVLELSDQASRHLLDLLPPQKWWMTLRQMDTEAHHRDVRSHAFKKAVKDGLITWSPSSSGGSDVPSGTLFWPPDDDDDDRLNVSVKNSPDRGGDTQKALVKNSDQAKTPTTSQSSQQSKKKESLRDKIITLIISGHDTPETIKRHLTKTEQLGNSLIQSLIKLVKGLPHSQRVDLDTIKCSLAQDKEFRRITKQIEDELNGPQMS